MNFIAHRSLVEVDPCVNVGLAQKDEDLCQRLGKALDAVEKFDWRNLHTACMNGSFGSAEAINLQIKELSRFLILKAITNDDVSQRLAPSKLVERIWRLLILFSRDYRYLCDNILSDEVENRFIDHDPLDNVKEPKALRYYNTVSLYCKIFKECPPQQVWPHPEPLKRKKDHLAHLNSTFLHSSCTKTKEPGTPMKRLRFSPEIEVKVFTRDTASSSPPVAVSFLKPVALQLTPTRSPAAAAPAFSFETPSPPTAPQPSAFLLACQRVLKTSTSSLQAAPHTPEECTAPSSNRLTESPPTLLPVSVFSSSGDFGAASSYIPPEKGSPPRQQITLRFLDMDRESEKFDMNTKFGTQFKIILQSYKKKKNVFTYRSAKFNGVEIDENLTPNDLGMSSHDRIEVYGSIAATSLAGGGGGGVSLAF